MCRFVSYIGKPIIASSLIIEPTNSLINQSHHSRERKEPLNGDGFGFAWYNKDISKTPALYRSMRPAWNDTNLSSISKITKTECMFAHVRAATHGEVGEQNCHPFRYDQILMMHNLSLIHISEPTRPY